MSIHTPSAPALPAARTLESLQFAVEASGIGIWTWDVLTDEVTCSAECFQIHGIAPGESLGDRAAFLKLIHPEDRARVQQNVTLALENDDPYACEFRVVRPGGEVVWVANRGRVRRDANGAPVAMLGTITDIGTVKQTQHALQAALSASSTGTFRWDIRTDVLDWDDELDRLFGLEPGSTVRSLAQFIALVHPDDRQPVIDACGLCRSEGADFELEFRVIWPDGTQRWLYDRGRTFRDPMGRPAWMTGACVDITERKRGEEALRESLRELEASEARFRAAVEAASDILWTNDPTGRMSGPQPGWAAFTGQAEHEYHGYGWASAVHPDDAQPTIDAWQQAVATGTKFVFEHRLRRHDGEWRTFSVRALPARDHEGEVREWVGVHTDITEVRQAQEIIERQNDELRRADSRKDVFLATLAHELRNPLAPIRTAAEVLAHPGLDPTRREWASGVIQRQSAHMARLLDDLLDLSRITQGKLDLKRERVAVQAVIGTALEAARPLVERKHHRLVVDLAPDLSPIDADPVRLSQIISNLVTNAAKYTDDGGLIQISARPVEGWLEVRVADNGIGMEPSSIPTIFTMFSQVHHALGRAEGGLGVGLALVKGLVGLHGGSIDAASAGPGQGSCFTLRLPLSETGTGNEPSRPHRDAMAASPRRILVVDDNVDAADTMAALLRLTGHVVSVAYNGENALALARTTKPELAVLDIGMPGMDGYALARELRAQRPGESLVLVAVTGWGQQRDREEARRAGFDHHVTKPVDPTVLQALVAGALR